MDVYIIAMITTILISLLSFAAGAGIFHVLANAKLHAAEKLLQKEIDINASYEENRKAQQELLVKLEAEKASILTQLQYSEQKLKEQHSYLDTIGQKFETQFRVLANNILEDKARSLAQQQDSGLKNILEPLRQQIAAFKQEAESRYTDETKERASLKEQIRQMMFLNKTLADEANNLAQALHGQAKHQGDWGEMILERILQHTGLQKGIHYFPQHTSQNTDGRAIQPDIVIKYPDERALVIDAKVSLIHYEQYTQATSEQESKHALSLMVKSVKAHIDSLSQKHYHDIMHSLDVIIMFVPVEGAYIYVMQADRQLWQYAYNKRILLISPTNLIAAMKLIKDMWQRDAINKNGQLLAEKADRLYEKLCGYMENMEKVGTQLDRAHKTWQDAFSQLYTGRGNIISIAEQMKKLRATEGKSLSVNIAEQAIREDGFALQNSITENPPHQ